VDQNTEAFCVSAASLLEIAVLYGEGSTREKMDVREMFDRIESHPALRIIPIDLEIAREVAAMGRFLGDPADRTIVASARVHGLRLLTADQRIIHSGLVSVVE